MQVAVARTFGVRVPNPSDGVRRGLFDPAFAGDLKDGFEKDPSDDERKLVELPSGMQIGWSCHDDALRGIDLRLPDGQPLMAPVAVRNGPSDPSPEELAALDRGFEALVAHFGGDDRARATVTALTVQAAQTVAAPFMLAFALRGDSSNPATMDGVVGNPTEEHGSFRKLCTITFLKGPQGEGRLRVDYECRGGAFRPFDSAECVMLDPERSCVRASALLELADDKGRLRMIGAPSYEIELVRARYQKPYPPPQLSDFYGAHGTPEAREDLAAYAAGRGGPEIVAAAQQLQLLAQAPTLEQAERTAKAAAQAHAALPDAALDQVAATTGQWLQSAGATLVAAFDPVMDKIQARLAPLYRNQRERLAHRPDWPRGFEPPATYEALKASGNAEAMRAFHASLQGVPGCVGIARFCEELAELRARPGVAAATALCERWLARGPGALPPDIGAEVQADVQARLRQVAGWPVDAAVFARSLEALQEWTERELPGFLAAIGAPGA
jgi:hypothetical protein